MQTEETVVPTSEEQEEEVEETEEETEDEEVDWKSEAQKAKELADNYKKRAEKAEKKAKSAPSTPKTEDTTQLSPKDYLALQEAQITADDFDEVQDFAKYKGLTISEALKSSTLKTILNERKEERATASATQTKGARGVKPKTGEDYLEKAKTTGEIPTDDKAMQELILAKQNARRNRK